jgi:cytochrome c oxidase subunit 2
VAVAVLSAAYITSAQNTTSESLREFKVTAQKYNFSPSVIQVKRGDHVRLIITELDREHGFKREAFHIEQKLPKGEAITVEFMAGQAGTFPFQCSHFCGLGHQKMKGRLTVG